MTINIEDELTQGLRHAIEDIQEYPGHGSLHLVFPEISQSVVDMLVEDIEYILESHLNTTVHVDDIW